MRARFGESPRRPGDGGPPPPAAPRAGPGCPGDGPALPVGAAAVHEAVAKTLHRVWCSPLGLRLALGASTPTSRRRARHGGSRLDSAGERGRAAAEGANRSSGLCTAGQRVRAHARRLVGADPGEGRRHRAAGPAGGSAATALATGWRTWLACARPRRTPGEASPATVAPRPRLNPPLGRAGARWEERLITRAGGAARRAASTVMSRSSHRSAGTATGGFRHVRGWFARPVPA